MSIFLLHPMSQGVSPHAFLSFSVIRCLHTMDRCRVVGSSDLEEAERTAFLGEKVLGRNKQLTAWPCKNKILILTTLNILILLLSISLLLQTWHHRYHDANSLYAQIHGASPLYSQLTLRTFPTTTNGTLWPPQTPDGGSIARHMPNDADEAVWDEWELTRVVPVTAAQIRAMGKDPSTVARLDDDVWGFGDDAYVATFDVFHQIHCLNALRKLVYRKYYGGTEANAMNVTLKELHVNHCVDMLLQTLQCSGNLQMITMHWTETQTYPFPDMSIHRQCIDFDAVVAWRKEHSIDMDKYVEVMQKPYDVKQQPIESGYWDMFGYDDGNDSLESAHVKGHDYGQKHDRRNKMRE